MICTAGSADAVTILVTPTIAPNADGSPSWSQWEANSIYALENGLTSYGDSNLPTYYKAQSNVTMNQLMATSNPSWDGKADPGTVFGPAFADELGNRGHFGLFIDGDGTQFSISQLSFVMTSNDPNNVLGYSFGAGTYDYSSGYVGILFGPDGVLGGGDDTYITSGPNTQLVDALVGRGSGNALWPDYGCTDCSDPANLQAAIDANPYWPTEFTGTYTLGSLAVGSGTFNIVPEPAAWMMMIVSFGVMGYVVRRRKAAARASTPV